MRDKKSVVSSEEPLGNQLKQILLNALAIIWRSIYKNAGSIIVIAVIVSIVGGYFWLMSWSNSGNANNFNKGIVQPTDRGNGTFYFNVVGVAWFNSIDTFRGQHPELGYIGASRIAQESPAHR
jgi:hypothetical protein